MFTICILFMVQYTCLLCGFDTKKITSYERHLKTKKHLRKIKQENNKETNVNANVNNVNPVNSNVNPVNSNVNVINSNVNPVNSNVNPVNSNVNPVNSNVNVINSKIIKCKYCGKVFNKRSGKSRHENKFCKKRDQSKEKGNKNDILLIVKKQIENHKKEMEEMNKKLEEENKKLAEELELVKNQKSVPSVVNNIVTDKMMLIQLNKMPPKKFLNKYCYNTPTLDNLIDFILEHKITLSDAKRIKSIKDSNLEKRKVYLNYYYRNVIIIIKNCTRRLIEMKEIKDSYCDSTFILNDGNMRHYMEKKEFSWENNTDINKVCKIISIIGSQVVNIHHLDCMQLSKDDELYVAKEILKLNDWTNKKDLLIKSINKDDILMIENEY